MSLNRTLANLINTDGDVKAANLDLAAASITVVEALDSLPTSNLTAGDQAYVKGTSRFYVSNGAGWYNAALVNATPSLSIDPSGAIALATDGSTTTITLTATDSDYPDAALTYTVESDGSFGGLATVSQDSSVFTITPLSEDSATTTSAVLTFKASDSVSFGSGDRTLTLSFKVENSNYTTLLLKADSDGTDNQVDASNNAFTVTEYGNVTSTAFSPYHPGGYSTYFDGTGDYLTGPTPATMGIGTGDFTIECWFYATAADTDKGVWDTHTTTSSADGLTLTRISATTFRVWQASQILVSSAVDITNAWNHLAVVRDNGTLELFVNGVSQGTVANTTNMNSAQGIAIGSGRYAAGSVPNKSVTGYISDFRVTTTAVYTSDFTPPTERLTAIANTELLACHLPYIADGSSNDHTITIAGNTTTKRFGPLDYLGYTKADHGGSVYFDGTGDYIQTPNGTYMDYGSGDFTFECWMYPIATNGDNHLASDYASNGNMTTGSFHLLVDDGILRCYARAGGVNIIGGLDGSTTIQINVWHHVALVRNGTTFTVYLNGASEASTTLAGAMSVSSQPFTIGRAGQYAGGEFQGYISNARLVKGTAVYTSAFTPPTAPLTAITNTEVLTCTNKNDIWDTGQGTRLLKTGDVTASNTQRKFTTSSSIAFDGVQDAIEVTPGYDDPFYIFGTVDFTIEMWAYWTNLTADHTLGGLIKYNSAGGRNVPYFYTSGTTLYYWTDGSNRITGSSALTLNTWHHIALTRSGNDHKLFVDGTQTGSTWTNAANYVQGRPTWGNYYSSLNTLFTSSNNQFSGYLQSLRITKGLARYTTNFTPPTEEFSG